MSITVKDIKAITDMKPMILVEIYNFFNPNQQIGRFRDRKDAVRRVTDALLRASGEELARLMVAVPAATVPFMAAGPTATAAVFAATVDPTATDVIKALALKSPEHKFMASLGSRVTATDPSDVLLEDIAMDMPKYDVAKLFTQLSQEKLVRMNKEHVALTTTGVAYCKANGITLGAAYLPTKSSEKAKEPKPVKEPKAPKPPKEPKDDTFCYNPNPKRTPHAVRAGSKIAQIIDLISRAKGSTMAELQTLMSAKATVRGILQYDLNALVGYGVEFDGTTVRIILPKGMTAPLPHRTTAK